MLSIKKLQDIMLIPGNKGILTVTMDFIDYVSEA